MVTRCSRLPRKNCQMSSGRSLAMAKMASSTTARESSAGSGFAGAGGRNGQADRVARPVDRFVGRDLQIQLVRLVIDPQGQGAAEETAAAHRHRRDMDVGGLGLADRDLDHLHHPLQRHDPSARNVAPLQGQQQAAAGHRGAHDQAGGLARLVALAVELGLQFTIGTLPGIALLPDPDRGGGRGLAAGLVGRLRP